MSNTLEYLKVCAKEVFYKPKDKNYFIELDGIRALALISVICAHLIGAYLFKLHGKDGLVELYKERSSLDYVLIGHYAVDIFFALSGFLIGFQLIDEFKRDKKIKIKAFLIKRVLRIYPLLCFFLFTVALFVGFTSVVHGLLTTDTLLGVSTVIPGSWSVSVEMHFYLLAPLLVIGLYKTKKPLLILLIIGLILLLIRASVFYSFGMLSISEALGDLLLLENGEPFHKYVHFAYQATYMRIVAFIPGVFVAWLFVHYKDRLKESASSIFWVFALITALIVLHYLLTYKFFKQSIDVHGVFEQGLHIFNFINSRFLVSVCASFIILALLINVRGSKPLKTFLSCGVFFPIAQLSYGIYLSHLLIVPIAGVLVGLFFPGFFDRDVIPISVILLWISIYIPLVIGINFVIYCFIERPFLRGALKKKILTKYS